MRGGVRHCLLERYTGIRVKLTSHPQPRYIAMNGFDTNKFDVCFTLVNLSSFRHDRTDSSMASLQTILWVLLISVAVSDLLIAAILSLLLWRKRCTLLTRCVDIFCTQCVLSIKYHRRNRTFSTVNVLIVYTISTGLLTRYISRYTSS